MVKNKYDIVHDIFIYLINNLPNKDKLSIGELNREVYKLYYTLTKEQPVGDVCFYCGRDEYSLDENGYGPCGCV